MPDFISIGIPNTIVGIGAVKNVGKIVSELKKNKVLIVTDEGVAQTGLLDQLQKPLEEERITFTIFDKCQSDAPVANILDCAKANRENGCDIMIGFGGGSVMDITKMASILANDIISHESINKYITSGVPERGISTILVPTTAGTGSEVSVAAVITDEDGRKRAIMSSKFFPEAAIVDPLMTINLPAKITADSGMDALSHAVEGYTNANANLFSEMLAEKAMTIISNNLKNAYYNGSKNIEARYNMAVAACISSISMSAARGGTLIHGMGYAIQIEAHCTHAESCAVVIPHIMDFNMRANPYKYARIAGFMGETVDNLQPEYAAKKAIDSFKNLLTDLNMPQKLRDLGIGKVSIARMADNLSTYYPSYLRNNPRSCSINDAIDVLKLAW